MDAGPSRIAADHRIARTQLLRAAVELAAALGRDALMVGWFLSDMGPAVVVSDRNPTRVERSH